MGEFTVKGNTLTTPEEKTYNAAVNEVTFSYRINNDKIMMVPKNDWKVSMGGFTRTLWSAGDERFWSYEKLSDKSYLIDGSQYTKQ